MKSWYRIVIFKLLLTFALLPIPSWAVIEPQIGINPATFTTSIPSGAQQTLFMTISNVGTADLFWDITELESGGECFVSQPTDVPWISVSPTSGTTPPGSSSTVNLVVDSTGLSAGTYMGKLCVGNNTPGVFPTIPISLTVEHVNEPPECGQASPSIPVIWPPNYNFVDVQVLGVTDPDGDPVTITINSIYQDEPVGGKGNGMAAPDGQGIGTSTAQIRAERAGRDNGRVYHITFTANDTFGGACIGEVMVSVPHDQSGAPAVDEGPLYDSTISP